jgi:predicted nucleic acid-binding protein
LLVVDSAVVVTACLSAVGLEPYSAQQLVAPPLMWSESTSVLHELRWRREITNELATDAFARLRNAPIAARSHKRLHEEAWKIADRFGWAKTYDAEYVALAQLLKCRLLTIDARLKQRVETFIPVIGPTEL